MPIQATTTLPDSQQATLGNGVEDEVSYSIPDDTNNGDYRIQIRETGESAWDGTAVGFAEDVIASDGDTSGTIDGIFTGREDGEEYEVRARTETSDVTGTYTTPVSIVTLFPGADNLRVTSRDKTSVALAWDDNSDNEDGFRVQRRIQGETTWNTISTESPNTTTFTDTTVDTGTIYQYRIEAFTEDTSAVSNTVETATYFADGGVIIEGSAGTINFGFDEILESQGIDAAKTHTGIGDFRILIRGSRDVEDFAARQDQLLIQTGSGVEFIGYLEGINTNLRSGNTELRGKGIAKRLEETRPDYESIGGPVTYQNTAVDDALNDYWARTPFTNYTVYDQPTESVATNELVQDADLTAEWDSVTSLADTDPVTATSDQLQLEQIAFTTEGEDETRTSGSITTFNTPSGLSDGIARGFSEGGGVSVGDSIEWDFTPAYDIPADSVGVQVRAQADDALGVDWILNGQVIDSLPATAGNLSLSWDNVGNGEYSAGAGYTGGTLSANTTYTLRAEVTAVNPGEDYKIDVVAPYDERCSPTFDNSVDGNGYLSGPELYPDIQEVETEIVGVEFNITDSAVSSTWNDTTGNQAIAVSNDGGASYTTFNNTDTVSHSYTDAGREARLKFSLSRYGSRTTATPTDGYLGQVIDEFEHRVDGDNLAVVVDLELSKNHFDNLQTLHSKGEFVWNITHSDDAISDILVESFRRGTQTKSLPVSSELDSQAQISGENYYNSIYLQGSLRDDGTRPSAEVSEQTLINQDGREISPGVLRDLDISTDAGAVYRARALLDRAKINNSLRGTKTYPADFSIQPGYSYPVDFGDGSIERTLEEVQLRYNGSEATSRLDFVPRQTLAEDVSELKRQSRQQSDQV